VRARLLGAFLIPTLTVGAALYVALHTAGDWASTAAVGFLAALAWLFWLVVLSTKVVENAWRPLAQEAVTKRHIEANYAHEVATVATTALHELRRYDEQGAAILASRLLDATAKNEELA